MKKEMKDALMDVSIAALLTLRDHAISIGLGMLTNSLTKATAVKLGANKLTGASRLASVRALIKKNVDGRIEDGPPGVAWAKFAMRKGLPGLGQKRMAIENDPHTIDDFDGEIEKGYGKGQKKLIYTGHGIVKIGGQTQVSKINLHEHRAVRAGLHYDIVAEGVPEGTKEFEIYIPNGPYKGKYAFIQPKGFPPNQRLVLPMKDQGIRQDKPDYTLRKEEFFSKIDPELVIVERKVDGSLGNAHVIDNEHVAFRSHREEGETYDHRLPAIELIGNQSRLLTCRLLFKGPDLRGNIYQGELYHPEGSSRVSGILNSMPDKAIQTQRAHGPVKFVVWDKLKDHGKSITNLPYEQRRAQYLADVKEIQRFNSNWSAIEARQPGETIEQFYNRVISDPLPQGEGIVIKPKGLVDQKWDKMKFTDFHYFRIKSMIPGEGKDANTIGRMEVENLETGAVGEVGSFAVTREFKQWLYNHPNIVIGAIAKIRAMKITENGVPRAGVFVGLHNAEDKLVLYADSIAGSDNDRAKELMYQFKSAAGWRSK